jgi:hypothetical protein
MKYWGLFVLLPQWESESALEPRELFPRSQFLQQKIKGTNKNIGPFYLTIERKVNLMSDLDIMFTVHPVILYCI